MEAITVAGLIAFLKTKVVFLVIGAGIPLAWTFLKKFIPGIVEKQLRNLLKKSLDPQTKDEKLKNLIQEAAYANGKLAEYLLPNGGLGIEKRTMVTTAMASLFKNQSLAGLFVNIIDEIVKAADAELIEIAEESKKELESNNQLK